MVSPDSILPQKLLMTYKMQFLIWFFDRPQTIYRPRPYIDHRSCRLHAICTHWGAEEKFMASIVTASHVQTDRPSSSRGQLASDLNSEDAVRDETATKGSDRTHQLSEA